MILFRYLTREIIATMLAVSTVLLLIIMSGRFVKYLAEAASGAISANVLFLIMGLRMPGFLELILPLGLFLGILLGYGRLYMESEMVVLSACGVSRTRLVGYTLVSGILVSCFVGFLSLYVGPAGMQKVDSILKEQKNRSEWETLTPGRFEEIGRKGNVTYVESLSDDNRIINNVFIAETSESSEVDSLVVVTASRGKQVLDEVTGRRYMVLEDGYRYRGLPGQANYEVVQFEEFGQLLPEASHKLRGKREFALTSELWASDSAEDRAILHWRMSLPVLVLVVTLLAIPLSQTNPRQGRYSKLIPAILLYIIYLVSLNGARGAVEDGKATVWALWFVHSAFFAFALLMLAWPALLRSKPLRLKNNGRAQNRGHR